MVGVGLVGCGLVGQKRARVLGANPLRAVADRDLVRARHLASQNPGCTASQHWQQVTERDDVAIILVATTHDSLAEVTRAAVAKGKHVLVEKPAARCAAELVPVLAAARNNGVTVKVGFNHRFHPALWKAWEIFSQGGLGPLLYIRARYGHGGRLGYEKEWRANPNLSGGGELLDQGVHLIDLARWFAGDFSHVQGWIQTCFWNMPVEDNAFLHLQTSQGQTAWLHASCTEWKNLFSFEIFGRDGKLQIDGLGGSYGVERLTWYRMLPQMGPPETTIWEYPGEDLSWRKEWEHFEACIGNGQKPLGNLEDALAVLRIVDQVYQQNSPTDLRQSA